MVSDKKAIKSSLGAGLVVTSVVGGLTYFNVGVMPITVLTFITVFGNAYLGMKGYL
ncbi:MAG: hypothetical protein ACOCP8_09095 [archaeon]